MVMRREIAVELIALSRNFFSAWFQKNTEKWHQCLLLNHQCATTGFWTRKKKIQ